MIRGPAQRLRGASGFAHQIDASLRAGSKLWLIECKCWSRSVGAEAVLMLASRLHDIQAADPSIQVSATLVTTQFVTEGAVLLASHFQIQLDQVASVEDFVLSIGSRHFVGNVDRVQIRDETFAVVSLRGSDR